VDGIRTEVMVDSEYIKSIKDAPPPAPSATRQPARQVAQPVVENSGQPLPDAKPVESAQTNGNGSRARREELPNDYMPPEPDFFNEPYVPNGNHGEVQDRSEEIAAGDGAEHHHAEPDLPEMPVEPPSPEPETESVETILAADQQAEYQVDEAAESDEELAQESESDRETIDPQTSKAQLKADSAPVIQPEPAGVQQDQLAAVPQSPVPSEGAKRHGKKEMVTIVMRSLGDKERDILRMRRVYGMLISEPGEDQFAFYVIESDRGYRLEFPNDTTDLTEDMKRKIEDLMGKSNVIIEPITIQ